MWGKYVELFSKKRVIRIFSFSFVIFFFVNFVSLKIPEIKYDESFVLPPRDGALLVDDFIEHVNGIDEKKIVFLGTSVTQGNTSNKEGASFPKFYSELLKEDEIDYSVFNFGMVAARMPDYYLLMKYSL